MNCGAVNRNAALRNTSMWASRLGSMGFEYPPPMVITSGTSRAMHMEYTALFRRSNPSRLIARRYQLGKTQSLGRNRRITSAATDREGLNIPHPRNRLAIRRRASISPAS